MASPATFPKVLNYAYTGMLTMYLLVAVFGYYVFGNLTDSPILSNLPRDGTLGNIVTVVKLLTAVSVLSSYPVHLALFFLILPYLSSFILLYYSLFVLISFNII